ncbi:MAG: alpha/beta hydrolase [Saccharofermentans sp.]|nr:alpha/beta hydrolase [Saccharofermentans sp.]
MNITLTSYLSHSSSKDSPLIVLNSFSDEWNSVVESLDSLGVSSYSLLVITDLDWNNALSPWKADAVFKGEPSFEGYADEYIRLLTQETIPESIKANGLSPVSTYIAGYSMAGLFALYCLYKTDLFDGAASCSGSLWFPGFTEYAISEPFLRENPRVYLSLGDRESKTKNIIMGAVENNTQTIYDNYKKHGIDCRFEMNPGGHFNEPAFRTAKGIAYLLRQIT